LVGACSANANDQLIQLQQDAKQWVMPTGNYANTRYSPLKEITADNVGELRVEWMFSTGVLRGHEGGPLVIGDVMYVHGAFPNPVYALDLNNDGKILWKYEPKQDPNVIAVMCCDTVNRGLSYADGKIFLYQADTTLVALDAKSGNIVWSVKNGDPSKGESGVSAPMVVKDKVLIGISGDEFGVRGYFTAYDVKTGKRVWRAYSVGPDNELLIDPQRTTELGKPVGENSSLKTWQGDQWKIGGGSPSGWMSYDPQLNLIYYGSGNASTGNPKQRPGANKWSTTIWARDVDTGMAKWVYQMTPHDEWAYRGSNEMILVDQTVGSESRKTLVHFDTNGLVYTLDRTNGELLIAEKYDPNVNWTSGVDMDKSSPSFGRPKVVAGYSTEHSGEDVNTRMICPAALGAKGESPAAYSPDTGLFYVPTNNMCMDFEPFRVSYTAGQPYVGATVSQYPRPGETDRADFIAWDAKAGKIVWSNKEPFSGSGALATAGGVVFYGTLEGYLKAVDAKTGKELYKFKTPSGIIGNVVTYEHGGKQYVAVLSGVGGSAGIGLAAGLTDPNAGLGAVGGYAGLSSYTSLGGTLAVFGLPATPKSVYANKKSSAGETQFQARAVQGVYWNTYFTRDNEPDATLSTQSQGSYTLVLDLSAYNYRQVKETNAAGTAVDPLVKNALEKAPLEPLELKIRPVAVSPLLTIEDGPVRAMTINRKKLVRPQEGAAVTEEERLIDRFKVGGMTLPEFSAAVAAGQATFRVRVADSIAPGCAVIAFTIWDFRDNPIDHLLQTVPVGDGRTQPDCSRVDPEALKGGFATLLNPVFSIGGANPQQPIQAALHLFQIMAQGKKKTVAIFIDKTHYQPPQLGQPASEQGVYGWQMSQWLSDYISDPNGLPGKINAAWNAADSGAPGPYAEVANELAEKIFGADVADQAKADAAREALRRLATTQTAPVVVVRMVDENNRELYVPLNLISAAGNTEGLAKPITVVQPLQTERYEAPSCIRKWAFGLSEDTKDLDANLKNELNTLFAGQPPEGETWIRNAADLKTYFKSTRASPAASAPATPVPAEGLVILAHYDGFGIFFDDINGRVLAPEGLRHLYPPGSIAVLAACGTAKPNTGMDVLNGLNDRGVDAMIVSPFNVRIDYGSRMAFEFAKVVRDNRQNRRTPTLAEMFAQATAATRQFFKNQNNNARLEDVALEFILAGNPYLQLCSP
jgi:PQQ-dependent dehydrogenase (methanol/ethanol family)